VATRPTITVEADPQALQAAIKALEAYEGAAADHERAVEAATATRDAAVEKAEAAYAEAVGAAEAKLAAAKDAAAAAGVNFNESRPKAKSTEGAPRNRRLTDYDARRALPKGDFTVREYADALGRDAQTAGNWLRRMVEVGAVKESGSRAGQGPGRAAKLYTKV